MSAIVLHECLGDRIQLILPERPDHAIPATEMQFWLGAPVGLIRDACRTLQSYGFAHPELGHKKHKNGSRPVLLWWGPK